MQSVEKLFAVVDRKVDAFDFAIKKVKGKQTGNEYYAVSGECIINGEPFVKRVLTIGCPKSAIDSIVKAVLRALDVKFIAPAAVPELKKVEAPKVTLSLHEDVAEEVAPGLRKITPTVTEEVEEVDEDEYDFYDEDDEDICPECSEYTDECICDEDCDEDCGEECESTGNRITLTPVSTPAPAPATTSGPKDCPYCGAKVAPNFAYCPMCGGQQ